MLTNTDLSEVDKRIKKAISENNIKLFSVLASKKDLENYATKNDLQKSTDMIMGTLDRIYRVVKKNDEEQTVISHSVRDNKMRITKLEKAVFSN